MNILVGFTGSVATKLHEKLINNLLNLNYNIKCVYTKSSLMFTNRPFGVCDTEEENYLENNTVQHIDLRNWADILLIAPLSANTLAKIANGICDNLLTNVARCWDFKKPFIVCPAMNTLMYEHPVTSEHLNKIKTWGISVIPPIEKTLFCGETGIGAMAPINKIIEVFKSYE
jgi:phosphopantothenoylcysteine decarboxylase